ncbi:conserved exported hypothetical protein [Rubrivivax sp. A210]|uniref:hypothetical protein n=1 Tax=Rubrivivax sp. A210 TaxID=2772301 RepID=UPI00191B1AF2|nr:hypothetical protein [Rubrivivax sp. A210]CAD5372151.1 conserved exported hypothetical protein [Rubrivivax sp. A210]
MKPVHRLALALLPALASVGTNAADAPWPVVGQQGLTRIVIVPVAQARDRDAYLRQIQQLCEPERTCFLNFYTNSSGAALESPLPDAIAREATAVYRRSAKQGAEALRWSCRMQNEEPGCF